MIITAMDYCLSRCPTIVFALIAPILFLPKIKMNILAYSNDNQIVSRILLTFPQAENSYEINPSHMVFMICNFAQCI